MTRKTISMNTSRRSSFRTKWTAALLAAVVLTTAAGVGLASAGHEADDVASYTGCLTKGGALASIRVGGEPAKPCEPGAVVAHFSAGDITEILAGTGLTGGASNGEATVSLAPSYRLPQGCTSAQVAEWDGEGWSCADDDSGAQYTAGEGLELDGTQLSVKDLFQLPQDCELGQSPVLVAGLSAQLRDWGCGTHAAADQTCPSGQFARAVDEDGDLGCATPSAGSGSGSTAYLAVERNPNDGSEFIGILSNNQWIELVRLDLPPGDYAFQAAGSITSERGGDLNQTVCELVAGSATLHELQVDDPGSQSNPISLLGAASLPSGGPVTVQCSTIFDGVGGYGFRLVATSVGALG